MLEVKIKQIVEAAIFAASDALTIDKLQLLFAESQCPDKEDLLAVIQQLSADYSERGVELVKVASGYRFQARAEYSEWLQRLWQQRPPRYSRALFETLSLIAYKQPLTRGEIEEVRGVAVSSQIVKTLMDRGWVRVVGHRDLPGKPALLATTKDFLDYFNLQKLTDLPPLSELMDFDELEKQLGLALPEGMQVERVDANPAELKEVSAEIVNANTATVENIPSDEVGTLASDDSVAVSMGSVAVNEDSAGDFHVTETRENAAPGSTNGLDSAQKIADDKLASAEHDEQFSGEACELEEVV